MPHEDMPIDSPEYAKAAKILKEVLPEGTDVMKIWSALQAAGMTITDTVVAPEDTAATAPLGVPAEAAPSGAPIEGEPTGPGLQGTDVGNGPPTEDLILKAFRAATAEKGA